MKKVVLFLLKMGLSLGILGFLLYQASLSRDENGERLLFQLWQNPKDWGALGLGFLFSFLAVFFTIGRWWYLMRIQAVRVGFWETLRVGYIGYLFNLAPMGIVGGDLLKAWLILGKRRMDTPMVLASVLVDRLMGLYALFFLASLAILGMGVLKDPGTSSLLYTLSVAVLVAWLLGTILWLATFAYPWYRSRLFQVPEKAQGTWREIPGKIVRAVWVYRHKPWSVLWVLFISLGIHTLFAISIYFIATGLWKEHPTFWQHGYISPTSMSTSAIPLPFGPYEAVLDLFYKDVTGKAGLGLMVALAYRIICLLIASLGVLFYFLSKEEVQQTLAEEGTQKVK